jgi:hypothetical protein
VTVSKQTDPEELHEGGKRHCSRKREARSGQRQSQSADQRRCLRTLKKRLKDILFTDESGLRR